MSLASLSAFLQQQGLPPGSQAAILSESGEVIASQPSHEHDVRGVIKNEISPTLQLLLAQGDVRNSRIFSVNDQDWYGSVINIHSMDNDYRLAIATPAEFLTAGASSISNRATLIASLLLLLSLPVIWVSSRKISPSTAQTAKRCGENQQFAF